MCILDRSSAYNPYCFKRKLRRHGEEYLRLRHKVCDLRSIGYSDEYLERVYGPRLLADTLRNCFKSSEWYYRNVESRARIEPPLKESWDYKTHRNMARLNRVATHLAEMTPDKLTGKHAPFADGTTEVAHRLAKRFRDRFAEPTPDETRVEINRLLEEGHPVEWQILYSSNDLVWC